MQAIWTAKEVRDKIQGEGGIYEGLMWGVHQVPVDSDELCSLLDIAGNAYQTLDTIMERIEELARQEE